MADQLINVKDPDSGEVVGSVPHSQLQSAISQGYEQATPEEAHNYFNQQQYGNPLEQAKTALEGAASAATFGGSTAVETETGLAKPEDIQGRREANPVSYGAGQLAGLVGSHFIGTGEASDALSASKLLSRAGTGATEALGLGGETLAQRVGSGAVSNAVESALFQAGDEASKHFSQDPNQTGQTALLNTGLGGLFGAGLGASIGAIPNPWKNLASDKMGSVLGAIKSRLNGGAIEVAPEVEAAIQNSGMQVAPEIRTGLSESPKLEREFNTLQESKTNSGLELQKSVDDFHKDAANSLVQAVGQSPENVLGRGEISNFDAGSEIQESIAKEIQNKFEPVKEAYDGFKKKFSEVPIQGQLAEIGDKIGQLANEERWHLSESSPEGKLANETLADLPKIKTLQDLTKYQSIIWSKAKASNNWSAAGKLVGILRDAEGSILEKAVGPEGAQALAATRKSYGQYSSMLDDLNSRLRVGKYRGADSFIENLRDMKPEDVLNRTSKANDAGLIDLLQKEFPEASQMVKDYHVKNILAKSAKSAPDGFSINSKNFLKQINEMTPELKKYVLPEGAEQKIKAVETLLENVPKNKSSLTAGNWDKLQSFMPASAMGMISMLMGHNPIAGAIVGQIGRMAGRDAPDAARLALLKFLGSDKEISAPAMKAMIDFIHHTIQGQNLLAKSVKSVFEGGETVLPTKLIPDDKSREKFDSKLQDMQTDPKQLFETGGELVHYLPDHGQALAQVAAQSSKYLNSIRPMPVKQNPLDEEQKPSQIQKAKFNRALDIAQQPLLIFQHIKDGTILPDDVINLKMTNPNIYNQMVEKAQHQMMDTVDKGINIPYKTRLGLSLFMGQTLDSTISPQAIMAAQPQPQMPPPSPAQGTPQRKGNMKDLSKVGSMNQTPLQARESSRDRS